MNRLKKLSLFLVALLLTGVIILFCGCTDNSKTDKITVVTSIFPPYDFARYIGGDRIELKMLLTPGSDSHYYEATLSDIAAVQSCDIFIYNGGDTDIWAEEILSSIEHESIRIIRMTDLVQLLAENENGILRHDHSEDHENGTESHHEFDEHVWTTPENASLICKAICESLASCDPEGSDEYTARTNEYINELESIDRQIKSIAESKPVRPIVFADRFPFLYFTSKYGFEYYAAFSGCSADAEISLTAVADIEKVVRDNNVPVIFKLEFSNASAADYIAQKHGAKVLTMHSCHNVTKSDFDKGITYLDIMKQNIANIKEALA